MADENDLLRNNSIDFFFSKSTKQGKTDTSHCKIINKYDKLIYIITSYNKYYDNIISKKHGSQC